MTPNPRHSTTDVHTPRGPVARALARGMGIVPTPTGRRADAVMGLCDYEDTWDELARARGFDPFPGGVLAGGGGDAA